MRTAPISPASSAPAERERVRRALRAHAAELRGLGVAQLALFGSLARGEAGAGSDIDVLIDVVPGRPFSLWALGEARVRLSEILGREVDLLIAQDLGPELRRRIAPDLVRVF
jgi:predicted nucleotidyltransferase